MFFQIVKGDNKYVFDINIKGYSYGKILTIKHALESYKDQSTVAQEVLEDFGKGIEGCEELQNMIIRTIH